LEFVRDISSSFKFHYFDEFRAVCNHIAFESIIFIFIINNSAKISALENPILNCIKYYTEVKLSQNWIVEVTINLWTLLSLKKKASAYSQLGTHPSLKEAFGNAVQPAFLKKLNFLLKFNMVCTFCIVLMCWCQK
jgi:hypothetical protein